MKASLFDKSIVASDETFIELLAHPRKFKNEREFVDKLWGMFAPFADKEYPNEIANAFHQRYWEMYLTCSLLDQGFTVESAQMLGQMCISQWAA